MADLDDERAYGRIVNDLVALIKAAISKYEYRLSQVEKENKAMQTQMYFLMTRIDLHKLMKEDEE